MTSLPVPKPFNLRLGLALLLLSTLLLVPSVMAGEEGAIQDPPITYLRYDVEITLKPHGNFVVREIQEIQFNGQFRTASAEIPRAYTTDIRNVRVWEGDTPYQPADDADEVGTYVVDANTRTIDVNWRYEETSPGDVRTFVLQYEVVGGLWVYPDETILEWRAVPADRSGLLVLASQVTIDLPAEVPPADLRYTAYGPEFTAQVSGNQITLRAAEPLPDGVRFQVQVGFPPGLTAARLQPWQIEEDSAKLEYRLEAIDVDLVLDGDGAVTVTEHQRVAVDAGALYSGFRDISLAYLDRVEDIQLFEGDQAFSRDSAACGDYCYRVRGPKYASDWIWYDRKERALRISEFKAGEMEVTWDFPALVRGEATSFYLTYQAQGAVQVNEEGQRLNWTVVFPGRELPVEAASVRIQLPPGLNWGDVSVEGGGMRVKPDGSIGVEHPGLIRPNQRWQVSLIMPAGATQAAKPVWQRNLEAAQAEARQAEIRRARGQLAAGLVGALILVFGSLAVLLTWHTWGRDRPTDLPAEYLSQPPSDLPPGIVAYLVDERPTPKGVLASLFHLASLGLLQIDLSGERLTLQSNWSEDLSQGQTLETPSEKTVIIPDHLVILFNRLRPAIPMDKTTSLSRIASDFDRALPTVYAEMADEAGRFFTQLPAAARHRWQSVGQWLVVGGVVGTVAAYLALVPNLGPISLAPTIALIPVGLIFMLVSRWMPQRTSVGVEEAARWRAFQRYLNNLKDYADLDAAQRVLDDYFAYAVALDVEEIVLVQAEDLGALMPVWTYPIHLELGERPPGPRPQPDAKPASGKEGARPLRVVRDRPADGSQPQIALPRLPRRVSLQGLSRQLGRTLSTASRDVGRLLNTAAGSPQADTPFKVILKGTGKAVEVTWDATSSTAKVIGHILDESSSGGGRGGYRDWSGSSRSSSSRWSSSSSRRSSSRSSFGGRSRSGRSSSSRRSGGGGRRGFG